MAAGGKNIEVKVGALILVSLVLLGGFIIVMGGLSVTRVYGLNVDFDNPSGLQIGAAVKIAGVKVGKVDNMEYLGGKADPHTSWRALVRVKISVEDKVKDSIHDDAQFVITTQGVLGEPFIAIDPGSAERPVLAADSYRKGKDPPRLDVFLAEASDLMHLAHEALTAKDGMLHDLGTHGVNLVKGLDAVVNDNKDSLGRTVKNVEKLTTDADGLVTTARDKVDSPEVKRIIHNVDVTTSALAREVGPAIGDARLALKHLDDIAQDTLGPEQRASIKKSIKDLEAVAAAAKGTTNDVQSIVSHIKNGEGSIGALVMDEEVYDDLQELLRDIKHNPWKLFWRE
jgi:phospholipid/cholesterol/gamma-HCH transport system substrate-binding protein